METIILNKSTTSQVVLSVKYQARPALQSVEGLRPDNLLTKFPLFLSDCTLNYKNPFLAQQVMKMFNAWNEDVLVEGCSRVTDQDKVNYSDTALMEIYWKFEGEDPFPVINGSRMMLPYTSAERWMRWTDRAANESILRLVIPLPESKMEQLLAIEESSGSFVFTNFTLELLES